MSLKKILTAAVFGILTGCASVKENIPVTSDLFDKFIFLKIYGINTLTIGQDTDGDKYEDNIECYFRTENEKGESIFELGKVYEDADRNHHLEESEVVWERENKQEYDSRKKLVFLRGYVPDGKYLFFSVGYDTDNDKAEDTKEFYQVAGIDSSGHFTLVKVGADLQIKKTMDV